MKSERLVPIRERQKTAISTEPSGSGVCAMSQAVMCSFRATRSNEWTVCVTLWAKRASPHPKSAIIKEAFLLAKITDIMINNLATKKLCLVAEKEPRFRTFSWYWWWADPEDWIPTVALAAGSLYDMPWKLQGSPWIAFLSFALRQCKVSRSRTCKKLNFYVIK